METLLITWLQKFDTEIGEKQSEFEQLTEEYEAEQAEMNDLQVGLIKFRFSDKIHRFTYAVGTPKKTYCNDEFE